MRLHRTILTLTLLTACPTPQNEPTGDSTTEPEQTTDSDAAPTTGATDDPCVEADGCYACDPQEPAQLLNHCTPAACQPFANTRDRLPRLMPDGTLPPLP